MSRRKIIAMIGFFAGVAITLAGIVVLTVASLSTPSWLGLGLGLCVLGLLVLIVPMAASALRAYTVSPKSRPATRGDMAKAVTELRDHAQSLRKQQSKHEWKIEYALDGNRKSLTRLRDDVGRVFPRLEALAAQSQVAAPNQSKPRILLMTSNGAGLGHLTRMLSVAKHFEDAEISFFSLSSGSGIAAMRGYETRYFPSFEASSVSRPIWRERFNAAVASTLDSAYPDLVVFDGTYVYDAITAACRLRGIPLVWMQRGCWKEEIDQASLQRHNAITVSDAVIVPGDYGCHETVDVGGSISLTTVAPITLVARREVQSREAACNTLGLDPSKKHVLVQLGAGNIGSIESSRESAIAAVHALGDEWVPVVGISPIANDVTPVEGATNVQAYPLAEQFAAFEFAALAAGYNTVQECVGLGLPAVFVPNPNTITDDQERRAREVEAAGLGFAATTAEDLTSSITRLADDAVRAEIRSRAKTVSPPTGGAEVAHVLRQVLTKTRMVRIQTKTAPTPQDKMPG